MRGDDWVKLSDRNPCFGDDADGDDKVIIVDRSGYMEFAFYDSLRDRFTDGEGEIIDKKHITHWMLPPEPPRD